MIAELLSANFYAAGKYTSNIIMFPCSTSTCLQGVVALGPHCLIQFSSYLLSDSEVVYSQVGPVCEACECDCVAHCECESLTLTVTVTH